MLRKTFALAIALFALATGTAAAEAPPAEAASPASGSAMKALTKATLRNGLSDTWQHNRAYDVANSMYVGRIWAGEELRALCMIPNGDNYQGYTSWAVIYNRSFGHVGWVSFADIVFDVTPPDCYHDRNLPQGKLRQTVTDTWQHNRAYDVANSMYTGRVWRADDLVYPCGINNGDRYPPPNGTQSWMVTYNRSNGYVGFVSWADLMWYGGTAVPDCFNG